VSLRSGGALVFGGGGGGLTRSRSRERDASTPWYSTVFARGGGTRDTKRSRNARRVIVMYAVPSAHGAQAESERRETHARGHGVGRAGQVVDLVEHDHAEAPTQVLHVDVRRVVGGHGQGLHDVVPAADDADRLPERRAEQVVPLADQVQRGRDHEGAAPLVVDREARQPALPRPRREHDHPPPPGALPRAQRDLLIGPGLAVHHEAARQLFVPSRSIVVRELAAVQRHHDVRVAHSGRTPAPRALVPAAGRRKDRRIGHVAHDDGAALPVDARQGGRGVPGAQRRGSIRMPTSVTVPARVRRSGTPT
jgi:hypothetical protein